MPRQVYFEGIELRSIKRINREIAWRVVDNNPYEHYPSKPKFIQRQLRDVRGVGRYLAGEIYRKLVRYTDPENVVESVETTE